MRGNNDSDFDFVTTEEQFENLVKTNEDLKAELKDVNGKFEELKGEFEGLKTSNLELLKKMDELINVGLPPYRPQSQVANEGPTVSSPATSNHRSNNVHLESVTFGGKSYSKETLAYQRLLAALTSGKPFLVNLQNLGIPPEEDPAPGTFKKCTIQYYTDGRPLKRRSVFEHASFSFATDVGYIKYHDILAPLAAYESLFQKIDSHNKEGWQIWSTTMGFDPIFGVVKTAEIEFRKVLTGEIIICRGKCKDFINGYNWESYQPHLISQQQFIQETPLLNQEEDKLEKIPMYGEEPLSLMSVTFGGLRYSKETSLYQKILHSMISGETLLVNLENLGIPYSEDPAPSIVKTLSIMYRVGVGHPKLRSVEEGNSFDFSMDIGYIKYQDNDVPLVAYQNLFRKIDGKESQGLKITNTTMGFDPLYNVHKTAEIQYKNVNTGETQLEVVKEGKFTRGFSF